MRTTFVNYPLLRLMNMKDVPCGTLFIIGNDIYYRTDTTAPCLTNPGNSYSTGIPSTMVELLPIGTKIMIEQTS